MNYAFSSKSHLMLRLFLPTFVASNSLIIMELRVKEICSEKGIALKDLAKRLGITYQALFESINGNPKLSRLQDIAGVLGVELPDLFPKTSNSAAIVCPHCGKPIHIKVG